MSKFLLILLFSLFFSGVCVSQIKQPESSFSLEIELPKYNEKKEQEFARVIRERIKHLSLDIINISKNGKNLSINIANPGFSEKKIKILKNAILKNLSISFYKVIPLDEINNIEGPIIYMRDSETRKLFPLCPKSHIVIGGENFSHIKYTYLGEILHFNFSLKEANSEFKMMFSESIKNKVDSQKNKLFFSSSGIINFVREVVSPYSKYTMTSMSSEFEFELSLMTMQFEHVLPYEIIDIH